MPIPGKNSITYPYGFSFVIKKASGSLRNSIKNLEIPIIVSMGGVAASGGYWISAESDFIFAHETTVTGSIGVAALLLNAEETSKKIGLNEDGIEISNYDSDGNSELPIINSKGKIAAIFMENSSKIRL